MLVMNVEIGLSGVFGTFDHNQKQKAEAENELFCAGDRVFYIA